MDERTASLNIKLDKNWINRYWLDIANDPYRVLRISCGSVDLMCVKEEYLIIPLRSLSE